MQFEVFLAAMYYLKNEQECFIGYNARGKAKRLISNKEQIASFYNCIKKDLFNTKLISFCTENLFK